MSVFHGDKITLTIFGESHGPSIGMTLDGFPAGFHLDIDNLNSFLARRAPGHSQESTKRYEPDIPEFLSGIKDQITTGTTISAIIRNMDAHSSDYEYLRDIPRPGHADYTAHIKYHGFEDYRGGGAFSGRMTAPLCIAGGIALQYLATHDISVKAAIHDIGGTKENPLKKIHTVQSVGDSVGGSISCTISGVPAGIGGPLFEGLEGEISYLAFAIPAIKAIEFGSGFSSASMYGSTHNDAFYYQKNGCISTRTNHCGGILGGISNGMDITFRVAVKPTPSITIPQESVYYDKPESVSLSVSGRHDPCIVPRALPCVEAVAAIAIMDKLLTERNL